MKMLNTGSKAPKINKSRLHTLSTGLSGLAGWSHVLSLAFILEFLKSKIPKKLKIRPISHTIVISRCL